MKHTLKKYFIPHEHNNYHPHVLHTKRTVLYSGLAILTKAMVVLVALSIPSAVYVSPDVLAFEEQKIIAATNAIRFSRGVETVHDNTKLSYAAQLKTRDMADTQQFSHTASNGQGLSYFLRQAGYSYAVAGENLAMGYTSVAELMRAWQQSPTHYANLVDGDYQEIGIGVIGGLYNDIPTVYIAQHFAAPKVVVPAPEPEVEPEQIIEAVVSEESIVAEEQAVETQIEVLGEKEILNDQSPTSDGQDQVEVQVEAEPVDVRPLTAEEPALVAQIEEAPLYNAEASSLTWEEREGKTVITATVALSDTVDAVRVNAQTYSFDLGVREDGIYRASYVAQESPEEVFHIIFPAQVQITDTDGTVSLEPIEWESVLIVAPTAMETYTTAKDRLGPFMGIFGFTHTLYGLFFVFFAIAWLLNVLVEWRTQHHHVIAQSTGLLALLALFYMV